ncbi:transporter [Rossellomorea marisflavi]|nr:transporter [Rossellomorea marisflavi]
MNGGGSIMYDQRQFLPGFPGGGGSGGTGFPSIPGLPNVFPPSPPPGQGGSSGPPSPSQGGGQNQPPPGPPPNFQPQKTVMQGGPGGTSTFAVDPGSIRRCLFRYTYIWLNRDAFWFYPVFLGRRSIAGWRWIGFTWVYFGIDLDKIESFTCV